MDPSPLYGVSFCTGVGGLELGLKLALGDAYRCIAYCEREAFAASVLAARMAEGALDEAVIWDDLVTFPSRLFRDRVAVLTAGFPCQPHSLAGKRKGLEDDRWIWPDIARAIGDIRPQFVFLENVPGLVTSGGLDIVLGDLVELGLDCEWDLFSAEETGAPHRRQRWFCLGRNLANAKCVELWQRNGTQRRTAPVLGSAGQAVAHPTRGGQRAGRFASRRDRQPDGGDGPLADARHGLVSQPGWGSQGRDGARSAGPVLGDAAVIAEREPDNKADTGAGRRSTRGIPGGCRVYPPARNDHAGWATVPEGLEPAVCRDADGLAPGLDPALFAYRNDRLRAVGNGVVPISCAVAYLELARRLGVLSESQRERLQALRRAVSASDADIGEGVA